MSYLGDFIGTETIPIPISTNDGSGGRVEPSTAFEVADIRIYKGVSATQRSSEAGYAIAAAFDSMVGVQMFSVDLSDDTDTGFFAAGNDYSVVLYPDETVDSQSISKVIAQFSIQNRYMRGTDSGSTLSAADILTTALVESYSAKAAAPTLSQLGFELLAMLRERTVIEKTETLKKLDGSTTAWTNEINDPDKPTSVTRKT